jgi:hypothetical protein
MLLDVSFAIWLSLSQFDFRVDGITKGSLSGHLQLRETTDLKGTSRYI